MPAGLRVVNNSGIVQIDGTYTNFCLHSKQTATFTVRDSIARTIAEVSVPYPGQCLVAVHSDFPVNVTGYTDTSVWVVSPKENLGRSVTVYFFVPTNLAPSYSSGTGLRVFREDGTVAFDSSAKTVRIVGYSADFRGTIDTGVASKYAVVFLNEYYRQTYNLAAAEGTGEPNNGLWNSTYTNIMVTPTATGCVAFVHSYTGPDFKAHVRPPPQPVKVGPLSILLLDVRDY